MADDLATSEVTFGTYYVREADRAEFERVLPQSWAALHRLGFIEKEVPALYRSVSAPTRYLEVTHWLPDVMGPAHEHPDLIPIWTKLASLLEPHTPAPVDGGLVFDEYVPVALNPRD